MYAPVLSPDEPLRGGSAQDLPSRAIRDLELLFHARETHGRKRRLRHAAARHQLKPPASARTPTANRSRSVYDMYPDSWGPAKNRTPFEPAEPDRRSHDALQASLDRRDNGGQRPDDN